MLDFRKSLIDSTLRKVLQRLAQIIDRTRAWRAAPAQASRVLAVWVAFVLSLDHDNRTAAPVAQNSGWIT